jgi:antitoxin HigA-1
MKKTPAPPPLVSLPIHRPPTHPGDMLAEEFLKPLGLAQVRFAEEIGVPVQRLNGLVKGRRSLSADTALSLAQRLDTTPQFWMNLQANWDLWHAQKAQRRGAPPKRAVRVAAPARKGRRAPSGSARSAA